MLKQLVTKEGDFSVASICAWQGETDKALPARDRPIAASRELAGRSLVILDRLLIATAVRSRIELKHFGVSEGRTSMRALAPLSLCATACLGVLAFWGGMSMAGRSYPSEYDWRYMTISSLVYGDRNPHGYLWARGGIVLCGLAGLYWTTLVVRKGNQAGVADRPIGIWALGLGYLCMTCCALLPERLVPIPKGHDFLALVAFVGICVGMVHSTFKAVERRAWLGNLAGSRHLHAGILAGIALSPIVLSALAQAYVSHALQGLSWVSIAWRARGVPVYLSFAFWEWVTCAVFSVYMVFLPGTTLAARR